MKYTLYTIIGVIICIALILAAQGLFPAVFFYFFVIIGIGSYVPQWVSAFKQLKG